MKRVVIKKSYTLATAALAFAVCGNAAALPLTNLGFESGLAGYVAVGSVSTSTLETASDGSVYTATEGNQFTRLTASGGNTALVGGTDGAYLRINGSLNEGDVVGFDWAFLAFDYLPFNDFAMVIAGTQYLLSDIQTVGDFGDSGWQHFTWTAPTNIVNGSLYIGISNLIDTSNDSILLVDNLSFTTTPVSEPAGISLLGLGLAALGLQRKRATEATVNA